MPMYDYRCNSCGRVFDVLKPIAELDNAQQCVCASYDTQRLLSAPHISPDYAPYDCPITGKRIEGRKAHFENLRKHGCRVLEPGETEQSRQWARQEDAKFEAGIGETVERFIEQLPTRKREILAAELQSGLTAEVVRSTPNLA